MAMRAVLTAVAVLSSAHAGQAVQMDATTVGSLLGDPNGGSSFASSVTASAIAGLFGASTLTDIIRPCKFSTWFGPYNGVTTVLLAFQPWYTDGFVNKSGLFVGSSSVDKTKPTCTIDLGMLERVYSLEIRAGTMIDYVGVTVSSGIPMGCGNPTGGSTNSFSLSATAGEYLLGLSGRSGVIVDALQPVKASPTPTRSPTTASPTTAFPTTRPTTAAPTNPTTAAPTTRPTTAAPTTAAPTTAAPTTAAPTTPTTLAPVTEGPTAAPTELAVSPPGTAPSGAPSGAPTGAPTSAPTGAPTPSASSQAEVAAGVPLPVILGSSLAAVLALGGAAALVIARQVKKRRADKQAVSANNFF